MSRQRNIHNGASGWQFDDDTILNGGEKRLVRSYLINMPVLDAQYEEKKTYWHLHASLAVEHEVGYVNDVLCFRIENMSLTLRFEML